MNKFSMYVASAGLAALIGCQDQPAQPSQGSYEQTLQSCLEKLGGHTTGYTGNFTSDFTANVMRPHGANIDVSNEAYACTVYKNGFESIENPEGKAITVGEGPVVMLGEDDITSTYRDLVLGEANTMGIVSSYLGDKAWATEYVQGPIDEWVCENGAEVAHPDPAYPETRKIMYRSVWLTGNQQPRMSLPRSMAALVKDKYQVENTSEAVETVMNTLGWENQPGYSVNIRQLQR